MCKVASYIARKTNGKLVKLTANLKNVKRGEAGKLSTHVTAKIKIGDLTAEQKRNYLNKPMLVMFTA
jgi:putative redox protein